MTAATLRLSRKAASRQAPSVDEAPPDGFKQTEIGLMPESWASSHLGQLASIRYGLGQPPKLDEEGVPMIRATNIKRGRITETGLIRVKKDAIPVSRNPFLKDGDIIVVRSGAYTGDVAMVPEKWAGSVAGYDLIVSPSDRLDSSFAAYYLLSEKPQAYFRGQRDRSAQPHINSQQLSATPMPCPPLDEQHEIARILQTVDAKIAAAEHKQAGLEELFRAVLGELMTGRVRVKGVVT